MAGVVVCHGSTAVRERIVLTALGVPSLAPVRAAATVEELVTLARRVPPTIVLLDAHLPSPGPVEAIRRLRAVPSQSTVVMLAVPGDEIALDRAIALGARGYLAPDVGRAELAAVAAHILASPALPAGVPDAVAAHGAVASAPTPAVARAELPVQAGASRDEVSLTKREVEVLVGMSNGRSNAQIGQELFLSEDTIKTHARRLFRKLGAADRAQAVAIGLRRGLIR
ncbi:MULTISPECIES: response regulator transcription factor [unclassified Cellulomonas]|uniref:LuxR C-terminal-related transcriptional regulator n=1 Tax=unclassified Cellulomonas TaxID=2620175 RepID=UPI0019BD74B7|nr:response regulator transcription factor [Cellulomonas sp. ES6]MBD3779162.1 response regulator transcription factor [Micrococcales bacterium]WHP17023.1 response regulator transcription factor [Cellulomonas sp. ES6]